MHINYFLKKCFEQVLSRSMSVKSAANLAEVHVTEMLTLLVIYPWLIVCVLCIRSELNITMK